MKKVAVGILTLDSKVLVCQRKKSARYGLKWEFPGGKVEQGESIEACLTRELREELSVEATVGPEFFRQHWTYPDSGAFEVYYHLVPSFTGELKNNVFEQIQWAGLEELGRIDVLEGNREVVRMLVEGRLKFKVQKSKLQ